MIKNIFWRKAFSLEGRERVPYWEDVQREVPDEPDELTLLYAVVKELDGHTVIHEYMADEKRYYLMATTRHHLQDQLFQEFYEARGNDVIRTHRRLTEHNNRSYVTVHTMYPPDEYASNE
jgi:hypothetical protein